MRIRTTIIRGLVLSFFLVLLVACGSGDANAPAAGPTQIPMAEYTITFRAHVPADTSSSDKVFINFLDEVTGLALNPMVYEMQPMDPTTWQITLKFPRNAMLYYRYSLQSGTLEAGAGEGALDFRTCVSAGNNLVEDTVAHWMGSEYHGGTGVISGLIRDSASGNAIPGLIVTAGGIRTYTDGAGNFKLSGVPVGKQRLVAYDMDADYRAYTQEAIVADGEETPADLMLSPVSHVSITFRAFLPADTPADAVVRLAGSIISLGNTFQPGSATTMVDGARAPQLAKLSDGSYVAIVALPVGAHIRYKFTMGDGFWNAERDTQGKFAVRELVVPEHDLIVENLVQSWHADNSGIVTFAASSPADTPSTDTIYIQFSPFQGIWMRPIPMWLKSPNIWVFSLEGPLSWPNPVAYRYCRNGECGMADDVSTAGDNATGRKFQATTNLQTIADTITGWVSWPALGAPSQQAPSNKPRTNFRFGVSLSPSRWNPPYDSALVSLASLHAKTVFLSPEWYLGANAPLPELRYLPELASPVKQDLLMQIGSIRAVGMSPSISPNLTALSGSTFDWWNTAPRDAAWWDSFFSQYASFLYTYADLAQQSGMEELVIARANMLPAMPGQSGTPADAEIRWRVLIRNVRLHYGGKIVVELPLTETLNAKPEFLDEVDEILIRASSPLASENNSPEAMKAKAAAILDQELSALQPLGKPILLEAAYASAGGGDSGCPLSPDGACLDPDSILPGPGLPLTIDPNFDAQTNAYLALLSAALERDWISGFFAWGYYAPVALRDASVSIHGKPIETLLAGFFQ